MKTYPDWNQWIPKNGIEIAARKLLAENPLWIRKAFFARLAKEGFSSDEWFDRGMQRNEDADLKEPLWPWISFQAQFTDNNLIEGERYIRRRPSWQPSINSDAPNIPRITTIKEILNLIDNGLTIASNLYPRKLAQIVIGNFERIRDRLRNELNHLQHDRRTS